MASFTLTSAAELFGVGATVGAYLPNLNPVGSPVTGAAVTTAVVASDGSLAFTGLVDDTAYVAYDGTRSRRFRTAAVAAGGGGTDALAIHKADYTAKGTILSASAAGTPVAVAVGADNTKLKADSSQASGQRWAGEDPVWVPSDHGLLAWSFDPILQSGGGTPTAQLPYWTKVKVPVTRTFANAHVDVFVAGTGATALAGCFVAVFNSAGTRLGISADRSVDWANAGFRTAALTVDGGQSLTVTGSDTAYVWVVVLVGTQSTTQLQLFRAPVGANAAASNPNVAGAALRAATSAGGQTVMPTSFAPASLVASPPWWVGLS